MSVLKHRDCLVGMHQPVPDPVDLRTADPLETLGLMLAVQRATARCPFVGIATVRQIRPGVLETTPEEDRVMTQDEVTAEVAAILRDFHLPPDNADNSC